MRKKGDTQKLGGSLGKGGAPTLKETISFIVIENMCTAESKIGFEREPCALPLTLMNVTSSNRTTLTIL